MARLLSGSATLSGLAHSSAGVTGGISDGNHLEANANVADNDFLRVDGTEIEGRSASQTLSDIGAAAIGANSDITSITGLTTDLAVAHGGTGASTLTANSVLLGNGVSAPLMIAPSTDGKVLTSNGSTWQSEALPAPSLPSFYSQVGGSQTIGDTATALIQYSTSETGGFDTNSFFSGASAYEYFPTIAGKYFVSASVSAYSSGVSNLYALEVYLYKGTTIIARAKFDSRMAQVYQHTPVVNAIVAMDGSSHKLTVQCYANTVSSSVTVINGNFMAYQISL